MRCLVSVKFSPDGSLPPEEFFNRINARWNWQEDTEKKSTDSQMPRLAVGIADYDSLEQLAMDLAIMPGAGIYDITVYPLVTQEIATG
jgi:hypothetical protein